MNNIEKLARTFDLLNEQGRQAYYADDTEYFLGQLEDFAKAYANSLQSSEPVAWVRLSDSEWVNIVNHECAYEDYSKDDAVSLAVKLTEAKCKENNARYASVSLEKYNKVVDALKRVPSALLITHNAQIGAFVNLNEVDLIARLVAES